MRAAVDEPPQVRLGAPGLLDATERLAVPEEEVAREDRGRAALQQQAPGLLGLLVTGQFAMGAAIYDAMQTTVEVSTSHASFFIQNMAAILVEKRMALAVYRPAAFIYGSF